MIISTLYSYKYLTLIKNGGRMKKKVLISIIIFILLLILSLHYWVYPIDNNYSCIQYRIGEEDYKKVEVKVYGTINKSLIRDDIAKLKFKFNDKEYPDTLIHPYIFPINHSGLIEANGKIRFNPTDSIEQIIRNYGNDKYYIIDLAYSYWDNRETEHEMLGELIVSKDFKSIIIEILNNSSYGLSERQEVIVSESNIDECALLIKDVLKHFKD